MIKIYLAGPDVFRENATEHLNKLKELCAQYGFEGLSPFDNEATDSREIFVANMTLMQKADIVIASLAPFRGPNVDDGTAFEMGVACAEGKMVYGYTLNYEHTLKEITECFGAGKSYPVVEDFGLCRNLMLCHGIKASGGTICSTFEDVLKLIKSEHTMRVKCINVSPLTGNEVAPPLELGAEYVVKRIIKDSEGNEHYDVGLESKYNYVRSFETDEELPKGDVIHWCHPSRFEVINDGVPSEQ